MKKMILTSLVFSLIASCSSSKKVEKAPEEKVNEDIKRDYKVIDSSAGVRPGWIEDADGWAREYDKEVDKYRYFSFETEPKVSREIACNLAKANAKSDIAGEIATYIGKELGTSAEGDASIDENNPKIKALKSYVQNTLTEKIETSLNGAAVTKTYWEKRDYKEKLGAKKDFVAYTCASLIRIETKKLGKAVDDAQTALLKETTDPDLKENVKKALEKTAENFEKGKK